MTKREKFKKKVHCSLEIHGTESILGRVYKKKARTDFIS